MYTFNLKEEVDAIRMSVVKRKDIFMFFITEL